MKRMPVLLITLLAMVGLVGVPSAQATLPPPVSIQPLIFSDGEPPVSGVASTFQAEVRSASEPLVNEPIELQAREVGAARFTTYASTTTDARGTAHASVVLRRNAVLRWHHPATSGGGEFSEPFRSRVQSAVRMRVNDRGLRPGQRMVVRGRVLPGKAGQVVWLFSGYNRGWCGLCAPDARPPVLLAQGVVAADGTYRLERRFAKPGRRVVFVRAARTSTNVKGFSRSIVVSIARAG